MLRRNRCRIFPNIKDYNVGPHEYLQMLERAADSLSIPVIGSLNGSSPGGWAHYAKLMEEAGGTRSNLTFISLPPTRK